MDVTKEEQNENRGGEVGQLRLLEVFNNQQERLKRIIAGLGFGPADAEDILQEVCLRVIKQPAEFRSEKEASQWLIKVTTNLCLMEHRQKRRFEKKTNEILLREKNRTNSNATEQIAIKKEELEAVREAMREIDGATLAALTLRYFAGLNSTEVGEALELNPSTVRSRLRVGRMILAEKLLQKGISSQWKITAKKLSSFLWNTQTGNCPRPRRKK